MSIPFIYIFPMLWGINGIFIAQSISDILALILSAFLVARQYNCNNQLAMLFIKLTAQITLKSYYVLLIFILEYSQWFFTGEINSLILLVLPKEFL